VSWLWDDRIPLGKVTLLDGDPGAGKSILALDLAARVSQGTPMPFLKEKRVGPADVVIFNDDDGLADTVRPRLEAAGADLTRIRSVDFAISREHIEYVQPALIILDPISAYFCLSPGVPPRQILKDLARLARLTGTAVLAVQYVPENGYWAGEISDTARSVISITTVGPNRRRLAVTKSNLRALPDTNPLLFQFETRDNVVRITGWTDHL
jgi:hypothetical protein